MTEGDINRLGNGDQVGEYSSGDGGGLHAGQAGDLGKRSNLGTWFVVVGLAVRQGTERYDE